MPIPRLGVLGTFVWDTIWHPGDGSDRPAEQWGGIAYSLAAAAAACPAGWEIVPIVRIGADLADSAFDFLRSFPHAPDLRGIRVVDEPTNRVELRYRDAAERSERLTGGVSGWTLVDLLPLVDGLDALYINFISGFELDLATAEGLRAAVDIPLYADLHSLFLGPPDQGPREPRRLPMWRSWLRCFDAVQLNETELALMSTDGAARPERVLEQLPDGRPEVMFVTRGGSGATAVWRPDARWLGIRHTTSRTPVNAAARADYPAQGGPLKGDPTGCGDIWGSVAFAALLERRPLDEIVARAHRAAVAKIRCPPIDRLHAAVSGALVSPSIAPGAGVTLDADP